jgi:hypothetical protein
MNKGSKRCQWRRLGGAVNCTREAKAGAILWTDVKGGAMVCHEHMDEALKILSPRYMTAADFVLWRARRSHV